MNGILRLYDGPLTTGLPRDAAAPALAQAGGMEHAPILVHRISPTGGRRVVIRIRGVDTVLGTAYSDRDLIEFLRRIEIPDPEELVHGDSEVIAWQGGKPHQYEDSEEPPPEDGG